MVPFLDTITQKSIISQIQPIGALKNHHHHERNIVLCQTKGDDYVVQHSHTKKKCSWPASQLPSSLSSTEGRQRAPSTAEFTVYFRNRSIADQKSLQLRVRTAEKIVRTNTTHFTISQTAARTVPEHPLQQLLPSGGQVLLHPPWPQCWPIPTHSFWTNHKLLNPSQYLQKQSKNSNSLYSLTLWYS